MVPEPLVQQFEKKRWGSGDENDFSSFLFSQFLSFTKRFRDTRLIQYIYILNDFVRLWVY